MRATAATCNSRKGPANVTTIKIMARRNVLTRLNYLAKSADWDEKVPVIEKWLGKTCRVFLGLSAVYFIAALILR